MIGYIHNDKDEQDKVLQVLKMLSEKNAIDELGIGRIRDAFADMMFPGTSTLQKHVKYFSLMPQVYKKACERRYNRMAEVKAEIVRLERIMTANLCAGSPGATGITGSEMVGKRSNNYVKYDPAYIYNSGLQTFGILRDAQVQALIYSTSKAMHEAPRKLKSDDEDTADDADEQSGLFQFCSFPAVEYDFTERCSLDLTPKDKSFIMEHILGSSKCKGTLLHYIVSHIDDPGFKYRDTFPGIDPEQLPPGLAELQDLARRFADFIYMAHVRYNYIYSNYTDGEMLQDFEEAVNGYKKNGTDIEKILAPIVITDNSGKHFCREVAKCVDDEDWNALDQCIIRREKQVKGSRRKLCNPSRTYDKRYRVHYYKLTYRWDTVRTFADELRKGGQNG